MRYTLDSNTLINLHRLYPKDLFGSLWDAIERELLAAGACLCKAVRLELDRGGDDLTTWAKARPQVVCDPGLPEIQTATAISNKYPDWVREKKNAADPWVVAHGFHEDRTIVTDEKRKGPNVEERNLGIPNVADEHDVRCVNLLNYLREQGWSF